ncbi:MAG: precorrin-2 dehydrogenase/sirohydrochlorin ferrochelatase family protein [Halobacteriota archaeon]
MRIPLFIELKGKNILTIGGGGVGASRAKKFFDAGANVKVLSIDFNEDLKELSQEDRVELVEGDAFDRDVLESLIEWCDLVTVAIGNLDINDIVEELARKHKALTNLANDANRTEVVVPFEGDVEGIRYAVTTEGKSGVVARKVRDEFHKILEDDEETIYFLKAMHHLKKYMKSREVPVQMRMKLYFVIADDDEFRRLIREEDVEGARRLAEKLVNEYSSGQREIDESSVRIQF